VIGIVILKNASRTPKSGFEGGENCPNQIRLESTEIERREYSKVIALMSFVLVDRTNLLIEVRRKKSSDIHLKNTWMFFLNKFLHFVDVNGAWISANIATRWRQIMSRKTIFIFQSIFI
jgi:hypothetical protein